MDLNGSFLNLSASQLRKAADLKERIDALNRELLEILAGENPVPFSKGTDAGGGEEANGRGWAKKDECCWESAHRRSSQSAMGEDQGSKRRISQGCVRSGPSDKAEKDDEPRCEEEDRCGSARAMGEGKGSTAMTLAVSPANRLT